jgi:hypothetical protein
LTYKEQYKSPFLPVMPGHVLAEYNNLESAAAAIKKGSTAAVFVEPVQVLFWREEWGVQGGDGRSDKHEASRLASWCSSRVPR